LDYLQVEAPSVTIISRPTHGALPKEDLEKGEYDLAIAGFYQDIPDRYFKQKLFQDDFVCVGNKKLFKDGDELSVAEYAELKHILISPQGDLQSKASELMKKKGASINYSAGLLSFVSPGRILSKTDLALTCPRKLANSFCEYYPLAIAELPIKIPPIHLTQVWHERFQNDAAHSWLRTTIAKICSKK
jgi:DNA-binding transcriptional LysR family regulator